MKRISLALFMAFVVLVFCTSCRKIDDSADNAIVIENEKVDGAEEDNNEEPERKDVKLTLYFPDNDALFLHAEDRIVEIDADEPLEYAIIRELFKGPVSDELSPSLDGEDLLISVVVYDGGDCVVDFKGDFVSLNTGGSTRETFALGSLVNSLCELDYIDRVAITVEGKENVEFGHYIIESAMEPMTDLVKAE